jgi:hypothetical protein
MPVVQALLTQASEIYVWWKEVSTETRWYLSRFSWTDLASMLQDEEDCGGKINVCLG